MLKPPTKGFGVSVNKHNIDLNALVEWLEGCITFVDEELSLSDIVDALIEEGLYREQDFARERLSDAFLELDRRSGILGSAGTYSVSRTRLDRAQEWQEAPAFSFCLLTSLQIPYRDAFMEMFGHDYTQQGLLLERLTAEALQAIGWRAHATGWSKSATASLDDRVAELAIHLGEWYRPDAIRESTEEHAKDAGLDVVCHLPQVVGPG